MKIQTLCFMHKFFIGKLPKSFDSFFIKTINILIYVIKAKKGAKDRTLRVRQGDSIC